MQYLWNLFCMNGTCHSVGTQRGRRAQGNVREDGKHERQWRYACPRCNLTVAYQTVPPAQNTQPLAKKQQGSVTALTAIAITSCTYFYIIKGALSQVQGQALADAFE